ncbi:olfactory receptor 52P1-like [Eublepharis macularius]|uniref:Olfactory receptor n=1 Tax=Eublepharis macularius TaxID=481883 RepID=A0AA97J3T1_EUBMA|nr:olfactory receptor 52P1-like [Eublepharis macularius]
MVVSEKKSYASNVSNQLASTSFFLAGLPGLENEQVWISIPFGIIYLLALLGNATLLWVVWTESSLHKPVYFFLSMLALTDMAVPTCILPKMLSIFWMGVQEITFAACLVQMFMVHALCAVESGTLESGTLTAMAYDRYVAICSPLSYTSLLTTTTVAKLGVVIVARAVVSILPVPFLASRLPYCHSHLISHSYCEHMAVVKLACGDTTPNKRYGLALTIVIVGFDLGFIFISYGLILHAVFRLPSVEARHKALGTCGAHVMVILYTPALFSALTHRFGHNVPHRVHIFLANIYLVAPAMLNPIVYGAKTKEIHNQVLRALCPRKNTS